MDTNSKQFGGEWTLIKLGALEKYLNYYTTALKNKGFRLLYIDIFAGSGKCSPRIGGQHFEVEGSAVIACTKVKNPFDEIHLFELSDSNINSLNELFNAGLSSQIFITKGDSNLEIEKLIQLYDWGKTRAVIFIDPCASEVKWSTLEKLSKISSFDIWYLFPISLVTRYAANDFAMAKSDDITEIYGSDSWIKAWYSDGQLSESILSDESVRENKRRVVNVDSIVEYTTNRLREIFPNVLEPLRLTTSNNQLLFGLYFITTNRSSKAVELSSKGANYILGMNIDKRLSNRINPHHKTVITGDLFHSQ